MSNSKNTKTNKQASQNRSRSKSNPANSRNGRSTNNTQKRTGYGERANNRRSGHDKGPESRAQTTITILVACVVALLLELCNFGVLGRLGGYLKYGMFGLFGIMAYFFPVAIVILAIYIKLGKGIYARKPVCGVIIFVCLCAIMHMAAGQPGGESALFDSFTVSAEKSTGGGIIGGIIGLGLGFLVGKAGTYIIAVLAMIVCLVIITEIPVVEWITGRSREDKYIIENESESDERCNESRHRTRRPERPEKTEKIYEGRDRDGNYVKIVHVPSDRKTRKYNRAALKRTANKAVSMRNNAPETSRLHHKAKGISEGLDFMPVGNIKDELREITRAELEKENNTAGKPENKIEKEKVKVTDIPVKPEPLFAEDLEKDSSSSVKTGFSAGHPVETDVNKHNKPVKENVSERKHSYTEAAVLPPKKQTGKKEDDGYRYPPLDLLERRKTGRAGGEDTDKIAHNIEVILATYGVNAKVINKEVGPSVTRYELQPELGTRVNKITSLADDLKLNLAVPDMRIEAPIPGRAAIGIEIPNKTKQGVNMRQLLEDTALISHPSKIAYAAGVDISGNVMVSDIAKMPHMLVAGTTGSGKSTFLNTILMAILYRAKPSEVGLIIIDPKKIEFGVYSGLPHLVQDVVTDAGQAVSVLRWAVAEMGKRYDRMKLAGARDFKSYNEKFERGEIPEEEIAPKKMAQIVIVIDELADLMMVASKEVESLIVRLAQLARAAGIHLIIAMQRPSVDVVTGLIKANIPARVALKVASGIDSRTIIDSYGAEKLLGNGDMLFMPTGFIKPVRLQGAFVSEKEVSDTIEFIKTHNSSDYYAKEAEDIKQEFERASSGMQAGAGSAEDEDSGKFDEFFFDAGILCIETGKASSSMLQRRFSIGFNRAARIVEQLEEVGVVGPQNGAKPREILLDRVGFEELYNSLK